MTTLSTGLRNHLADTGSLRDALTGCEIRVYAGTPPPTANAALGGATLLCAISGTPSGIEFEAAASDGVLVKSAAQTWEGTNAASGTATFFRVVPASDAGDSSTTALRLQGTVGVLAADLELSNVDLVAGAPLVINSGAFTFPQSA